VIVCVAPNPSIDKLFQVERLAPGRIHRPDDFVQVAGGKGLNVARAATTLGAEVHVVALLGGHAGRWIADELTALDIPCTAVWSRGETRSCVSVADRETSSLTEFYEHGSVVNSDEWDHFVRTVREHAAEASWATVSGSLPPGAPRGGYGLLAEGANVAADTRGLGDARPALLKLNDDEASELTGRPVDTSASTLAAAQVLREMIGGEGHVAVVTRGADGAVLVDPEGRAWHGSVDAVGPYPVGSGDAFLAGIVVALDRGGSWPDALRLALGAGAANAELPGAGRLDPARANVLAHSAVVEPER
jgi:1-phosphofructokinase family hexose kinase